MDTPVVLSLGELLWDMLPTGKRAGGAPVNFAYHAMRNGARGRAVSAVGRDALGDELVGATERAGIDAIIQRNDWPTGTVDVTLRDGIPEYTIVPDVAWDHLTPTPELTEAVAQADAVCFGTLALRSPQTRSAILELLDHASPDAMRFFDINLRGDFYSRELIERLLAPATVLKVNDEELALLRGMLGIPSGSDAEACRWFIDRYGLDIVILTEGATRSTVCAADGTTSVLPTPHVTVADTVGAGDSFSGTFTARLLLGDSIAEAHRAAVNTAAYVCTQPGAWPDYPDTMPDYLADRASRLA